VGPLSPVALEALYARGASRFLRVGGLRWHLRDEGAGPPLLLLHGRAASLHTWDGWVAALSGRHRCLRVDLPGFGLTGPHPERRYGVADTVAELLRLMDALGLERVSVAGSSFGGHLAWALAAAAPERLRALILIDAAGYRGRRAPLVFRLAVSPLARPVVTRALPRAAVAAVLRDIYGDPSAVSRERVDLYWRLMRREGNPEAFLDHLRAYASEGVPRVVGVRAPTLVQWGARDPWLRPKWAARFAADIEGAETIVYDDLGHVPMEEAPSRTAEDAADFLARRGG
jgi:pimeloyl-ACP methyl ester carboxylesterase